MLSLSLDAVLVSEAFVKANWTGRVVGVNLKAAFPKSIRCPLPFITTLPLPDLLPSSNLLCSLEMSVTILIYDTLLSAQAVANSSNVDTVATLVLKLSGFVI